MSNSITSRLIFFLTFAAALIIGIGMLVDFRLSRDEILERLRSQSQDTIRAAVIDMENWLDGVEGSTGFLARILEQREYSRPGLAQMLKDIVENDDDIFGAAIALNPQLAGLPAGGFAPYYFHKDGILTYVDLTAQGYDYQQQPWFLNAIEAGRPIWVEPYYDEGGGDVLMTTYAVPVYRTDEEGQRFLYGVVTADVTLDELHNYLQRLNLGSSGFGTLLSRNGIILSSPNPDNIMRHYSETQASVLDVATWREMFALALAGNAVTRQLECPDISGECVIRLGALQSTGWPVGVMYSEDEILAPLREYQLKTAVIGLATLLLIAAAVYFVTSRLTRPLVALARASDDIARGVLDVPLPAARGDDEVARLVRSFGAMKKDLKTYIDNLEVATASRSRLEGELTAARQIQMSMLPGNGEAHENFDGHILWAQVQPARSVGGDLYAYHRSGDKLYITVGDVSDKGVPAALFMARAISLIQQLMIAEAQPADAMALLNNALEAGNDNCMFVTLFLGVMSLDNGTLNFASAGHTPPSLLRGGAVQILEQDDGAALGLARDLEYPTNYLQLLPGDRLAIYTDGIDEAFNEQARMFGVERFNRLLADTGPCEVPIAGRDIFQAIDDYAGDTPQSDDITLMLLQLPTGAKRDRQEEAMVTERFARGEGLVSSALDWLQQALQKTDVPGDIHLELTLVAEEIITNIDKYSGLPEGATIELALAAGTTEVSLEARDQGIAFNPLKDSRRSPLGTDIESAEIGGLGVHLITQFTDQQSYSRIDDTNILRVVKSLREETA